MRSPSRRERRRFVFISSLLPSTPLSDLERGSPQRTTERDASLKKEEEASRRSKTKKEAAGKLFFF